MSVEPLTKNMEKKKEGKGDEVPAAVTEDNTGNTEKKDTDQEERYKRLIIEYGVPDKPKYIHKREQMYLMVEQNLSDEFIGTVITFSYKAIDLLRLAVFVTGEKYLLEQLPAKEPSEEQIRGWIDDYMNNTITPVGTGPVNSSVEKSLDIMGRHMVRQQEIASAQITRLTEYIKQINEMDRDKNERDMHEMRAEHRKEREAAQKQIELLSDENFRLNMKIEETQENAQDQAEGKNPFSPAAAPAISDQLPGYPDREESIFTYRRRMKEKKRRDDFIASVLGNGNFTGEQLAVIGRVVQKNFTLSQLQKICDPQVKPENMELLEAYYERRAMHG